MSEQKVKCPLCFRELMVQTEWAGMEVQCPLCQGTIRLPEFQAPPAAVAASVAAAPSYQPLAEVNCEGQTEEYEEELTQMQSLAAIASSVAIILYLVGLVLLFTISDWGAGLIIVGIILSFFGFIFRKRVKFVLEPGEQIILTCRLHDSDSDTYFTRITDRRVVLCAVEYPFLPVVLAGLLEIFSKPKNIAYAWNIEDIQSVEIQKSFMNKKMVIRTSAEELVCSYDAMFMKWWKSDEKYNAKAFRGSNATLVMTIAAAIVIVIVIFILSQQG
ncbi:MAG: hypothetical protein E7044_03640 [Lentisphaerae bacterium]|nr:hypothetical protein [Lentisphaerota bacterium]